MGKILVTGGAGYIGSFTTDELINSGFDVVVIDNLENGHKQAVNKKAVLEVIDLKNKSDISMIMKKYDFDAVIDFAAYLAVGESMENPEKYLQNNVVNFVNLLDAMKEAGCKKIIKSSTASTYGNPEKDSDFPLKEKYQENYMPSHSALLEGSWGGEKLSGDIFLERFIARYKEVYKNRPELELSSVEIAKMKIPTSIYGLTKLVDEILMDKYNKSSAIQYVSLRYFNVCGASIDGKKGEDKPNPTTLMTVVIKSLLDPNYKFQVFGNDYPTKDGTGVRDYIHPIDLASGHVTALKYMLAGNNSDIFNLGRGQGYTVLEVIEEVEKASGKKVKYQLVPRRSGDPALSWADPSKAQRLLGWRAKFNLKEMAESAWKWHSTHPEGYP